MATAVVVVVLAALVLASCGTGGRTRRPAVARPEPGLPVTTVAIRPGSVEQVVPRSFLGISTEYWTVPEWAAHEAVLGRVLGLLTPDGPLILRIGGDSADRSVWAPARELPEWFYEIGHPWLGTVRSLVDRLGLKVILDLNLVTAAPATAALWARTAADALGRRVIGLEIGNEPDIYSQAAWQSLTAGRFRRLPARITAAGYARDFLRFDRALDRAVPNIPMLAPALAEPQKNVAWIRRLLAGPHRGLIAITAHRYPLSACSQPGAATYPTINRVLSERSTTGMAVTVRPAVRVARRAGLPVRLTEINSVTCGGRRGVSNTFATALWAPDALFALAKAGVASAAVHVRAFSINQAFTLNRTGLDAEPLLYGLILFSRTLGPDPRLLPVTVTTPRGVHVKAWAVHVGARELHVLLINKGRRATNVVIAAAASEPATIERLSAPSVRSTEGETLAGQHLDAQGRWVGRRSDQTVEQTRGSYTVTLPGASAALITAPTRW